MDTLKVPLKIWIHWFGFMHRVYLGGLVLQEMGATVVGGCCRFPNSSISAKGRTNSSALDNLAHSSFTLFLLSAVIAFSNFSCFRSGDYKYLFNYAPKHCRSRLTRGRIQFYDRLLNFLVFRVLKCQAGQKDHQISFHFIIKSFEFFRHFFHVLIFFLFSWFVWESITEYSHTFGYRRFFFRCYPPYKTFSVRF